MKLQEGKKGLVLCDRRPIIYSFFGTALDRNGSVCQFLWNCCVGWSGPDCHGEGGL